MRKLLLTCAAGAALLTTGVALPNAANAMPLAPVAAGAPRLVDNVMYFCPPAWRCGPYGCGWNRFCGWRPGHYAYGPYGFARPNWGWHRWGYRPWGYRPWAYRWGYRRVW